MTEAPKPAGVRTTVRTTRMRLSKVASAKDTIHGFDHDTAIAGLTHGQFSLLDLMQAILDYTGPADLDVATFSVGLSDIDTAKRLHDEGRFRNPRVILDSGTAKRGSASHVDIADVWGPDAVRITKNHAKVSLIGNDDWKVVLTSSMNFNFNPRIEQFDLAHDPPRYDYFRAWIDAVFAELPPADPSQLNENWLAQTRDLPEVTPRLGYAVTRNIQMGPPARANN